MGSATPGPASVPVLFGGTAIAAHLHHRVSRDLDFFVDDPDTDLAEIRSHLESLRTTAVSEHSHDTLNAVFGSTKVQFLRVRGQTALATPVEVGGLLVAGLRDLLATKLKVIADRGALRDYFDMMTIEQRGGLNAEVGLLDYRTRFRDTNMNNLMAIVRGLGYFGDVEDDRGLPVVREVIETYWGSRQASLMRALDEIGPAD